MEIVRATVDNAYELGYVHAMSWQAAYGDFVPEAKLASFTPENRKKAFRKHLTVGKYECYLCYVEKKPMGLLILGKSQDIDADESVGEVCAIYLLPKFWGQGYGKQLMDFAIDRLKALSYSTITLWVLEKNIRARAFYEKYGFVFDGTKEERDMGEPMTVLRYVYTMKQE